MSKYENLVRKLKDSGEFFAAGFLENPEDSMFLRFSRAYRRYFENLCYPYGGEALYPCGSKSTGAFCFPDFSFTMGLSGYEFEKRFPEASRLIWTELWRFDFSVPRQHIVGGNMYTHSHPNFSRIIKEGLDSYEKRIEKIDDPEFREGLLEVMGGIRAYHRNAVELLSEKAPDSPLLKALLKVPFSPAETLYEGLVCLNFIYYIDGCDNIGRPDADLFHLYRGEDVTELFAQFFKNVDDNNGWSWALGPDYNPLTLQCLKAVKGKRRPSLELRVTPDMPDELWEAAIESISCGGGSPSLYNEAGYQSALRKFLPEIPEEDRKCFAGGGCTETMLAGLTRAGSLDAGINLPLVFEEYMRENLSSAKDFEEFYKGFIEKGRAVTEEVLEAVSESQKSRAENRPHPLRTLLTDDCIDKGLDFNAGGARYNWSVVNLAGLVNVSDSLSVIKTLVFEDKTMSGEELLGRLDGGDRFSEFKKVPRHGTDSEESNALIKRLSSDICAAFHGKTPWLGGKFLPSSIQFLTYVDSGKPVGATPDGRLSGEPLADSIGAVHQNDRLGVTAMLSSAAAIDQSEFVGTPVLNLSISVEHCRQALKGLALGYFEKGGMQLQITCIDKETMADALVSPEKYPNMVVRLGGYSEYFIRLPKELQTSVAERTIHSLDE